MISIFVHRFLNVRGETAMCSGYRENASAVTSITSRGAMSAKMTVASCFWHAALTWRQLVRHQC